jgi:hypothetical protein
LCRSGQEADSQYHYGYGGCIISRIYSCIYGSGSGDQSGFISISVILCSLHEVLKMNQEGLVISQGG